MLARLNQHALLPLLSLRDRRLAAFTVRRRAASILPICSLFRDGLKGHAPHIPLVGIVAPYRQATGRLTCPGLIHFLNSAILMPVMAPNTWSE